MLWKNLNNYIFSTDEDAEGSDNILKKREIRKESMTRVKMPGDLFKRAIQKRGENTKQLEGKKRNDFTVKRYQPVNGQKPQVENGQESDGDAGEETRGS